MEAAAWLGSGLVCGMTGVMLGDLVGLDIVALTFLVIPALAAALIGQLRSLWVTLVGGFVIGIVQSCLTAFSGVQIGDTSLAEYRTMAPFVLAIIALLWFARKRPRGRDMSRPRRGSSVAVTAGAAVAGGDRPSLEATEPAQADQRTWAASSPAL